MYYQNPRTARNIKTNLLLLAASALCAASSTSIAKPDDFARANFTFRTGDTHMLSLTDSQGTAMVEGDMIFGFSSDYFGNADTRRIRGLGNSSFGRIWPNGLVPYRLNSSLSESAREKVREAIEHWNSFEVITMVERTADNASAYPDFIDFVNDNRCASWVGYQGAGAQSIYAANKCSSGTMIHEIGHALGLLHEHTRSDRDQFVKIHWDRIDEDKRINFDVLEGNILLGDYDYGSIMHYGEDFFSNNGLPTIEPLIATNATIGQRIETSAGDRAAVAELYSSNLTLIASGNSEASAGSATELLYQATNNTSVGAHSLAINLPVQGDTRLLSYASSAWVCSQNTEGADIQCSTPVLAAGADSSVSVNLSVPDTLAILQLDAQLTSRTVDTDLSDNSDSMIINITKATLEPVVLAGTQTGQDEPSIASALDGKDLLDLDTASGGDSGGGGGGSTDPKGIAFLILLLGATATRRSLGNAGRAPAKQ